MKLLATLVFCSPLCAQTLQIVPSTAPHGGKGSLLITLSAPAGKAPVALQWKLTLSAELTATAEDILPGNAASAAEKSVVCAPAAPHGQGASTYACLLSGGRKPVANGTIFLVKYAVKDKASPQTVTVRLTDGMAVLEEANQLQNTAIAPAEGTITIR